MFTTKSNGKLLLTSEYLVLDGAKALAIPTTFGQSLQVEKSNRKGIHWQSFAHDGSLWFEVFLAAENHAVIRTSKKDLSDRLTNILSATKTLNPNFLDNAAITVKTKLDFPTDWGLGSSSTLLTNIAKWAGVDAYKLLELTFGGSGYDIACAEHKTPLIYKLKDNGRSITPVNFNPGFKDQLFFVHLNRKQNSRDAIAHYKKTPESTISKAVSETTLLTDALLNATAIDDFSELITVHENVVASVLDIETVKSRLFSDYPYGMKSLGGWGGDFIMVVGTSQDYAYFKKKGFKTIISYEDMVLSEVS